MGNSPSLRVATWNLDHASNSSRPIDRQIEQILAIDPDILILTETCKEVDLTAQGYRRFTTCPNSYGKYYSAILTSPKVCVKKQISTYDDVTAYSGEAGQRFHAKLDTHSRASWTVGA